MPSYSTTIDWELISAMGLSAAKDERDALHLESGFMDSQEKSHGAGKPVWGSDTGPRWQVTLNFYNHTGITAFPTGYEGFDPTAITPNRSAFYSPAVCGLLMKVGITENMVIGQSPEAMRRLVEMRTISSMGYIKRQFTRQMVAGGGSGFTNFGTLNGIDYTGAAGGVLERSAVGSQSNTIGGLSKATYGFAIGWNNVIQDCANAFSTNMWRLKLAMLQAQQYKAATNKHVWIWSTTGLSNLSRSAQTQVMYVNGADLDQGRTVPVYGGVKCYQEPQMPVSTATGGSSTQTYPLTAIYLDTDEIFMAWMQSPAAIGNGAVKWPNGYFGVGNWYNLGGLQAVMGCPVIVAGNLVTRSMGSSAAIIRGETY